MQKFILLLFALSSMSLLAVDPVQDYLSRNTFPKDSSALSGKLFAGQLWTGDNERQPPGGYLLRFEAPIGINGTSVTFVASSLFAEMRGSSWFAYKKTNNGAVFLADDISFGHLNFYLAPANAEHGLVLCEISKDKKSFGVSGFTVDRTGKLISVGLIGIQRDLDKEDADPKYEDIEGDTLIKQNHLTPFKPQIKKILLVEYLKNPSASWRKAKESSMNAQQSDPNDKEHLNETKDFSEEDAAQMWKAIKPDANNK